MPFRLRQFALVLMFVSGISMVPNGRAGADVEKAPPQAGSPQDLINAVNALRASYGLPPYNTSSILMAAAQGHAEYMAATGRVSHTGAGGSSASNRILALGYPLAGDLSLGGFRAENITSGNESMSAQEAVNRWTGDAPHLNTMVSPDLTEIGAGVAIHEGRVYYVIDCARPTDNGIPQAAAPGSSVPSGPTNPPGVSGIVIPVEVVTPNPDGDVIHEVKAGQTLWQLAISYDTKIDEIKRLNNLVDNEIFPGMRLLIKKGVFLSTSVPTGTLISTPAEILPTLTATLPVFTVTPSQAERTERRVTSRSTMKIVMGILALAVLGGIMVAWWGTKKE